MTIDQFWSIIDRVKDSPEPEEDILPLLEELPAAELVEYQAHLDRLVTQANRWELWDAAYVMEGGCSDDGFLDFRHGLIAKGKAVFEAALANPDSLADLGPDVVLSNEEFAYAALDIYEEKTGEEEMPRPALDALDEDDNDPVGEPSDVDDEDAMRVRFPRLTALYLDAEDGDEEEGEDGEFLDDEEYVEDVEDDAEDAEEAEDK